MDDLYREALRLYILEHLSPDVIERRLGIPFDESMAARLLNEATAEMGFVSRSPWEPVPGVVEALPDSFRTRGGIEVVLRRVPATAAVSTWEALRDNAPNSGRWPVVLSQRDSGGIRQIFEDAAEDGFTSASNLLDEARTVDAREYLDRAWQQFFEYEDPEELVRGLLSEQGPSRPLPPVHARLIPTSDSAIIGLFPCNDSFEIPAILGYGGWNGSPSPAEHVSVLRYWQNQYDARLQALSTDTLELAVGGPPDPGEQALALARDHFSYDSDIPSDTMYGDVGALASVLPESRHWHFWWD